MSLIIDKRRIEKKQEIRLKKRLKLMDKIKSKTIDFLTITFKNNLEYVIFRCKKFHSLLTNLKKNYGVENYFWVLEFQKRGVVHYHLLLIRNNDKRIGFIDKKKKYKFYVGFTNIKKVYSSVYGYLIKYMKKEKDRKEIIIEEKSKIPFLKVRKKIRYRRFGFGGKIRKMQEYKEIMENYIDKIIKKYEIEKIKNRELEKNNRKVKYKFEVEYDREEGLIIKGVLIEVYEKRYKNLITLEWEKIYSII